MWTGKRKLISSSERKACSVCVVSSSQATNKKWCWWCILKMTSRKKKYAQIIFTKLRNTQWAFLLHLWRSVNWPPGCSPVPPHLISSESIKTTHAPASCFHLCVVFKLKRSCSLFCFFLSCHQTLREVCFLSPALPQFLRLVAPSFCQFLKKVDRFTHGLVYLQRKAFLCVFFIHLDIKGLCTTDVQNIKKIDKISLKLPIRHEYFPTIWQCQAMKK